MSVWLVSVAAVVPSYSLFSEVMCGVRVLGCTVCPPVSVPLLARKFVAPLYSAVIVCGEPGTFSADVLHAAWPLAFNATAPQTAVPSALKVTEPSPAPGLPLPGPVPVTVAVNVTLSPYVDGFAPTVRVTTVCVVRGFTT